MRHPLRSGRLLFKSKWFAIGMAVATSAWFFHVAALAFAPMSVVQAVLSTGVVMLAVLAERMFGFKVGIRQWIGVGMTAGGLFLLVITLPASTGAHSSYSLAGMIAFESAMLVIGALLISGPRLGAPDHHHGVMLGARRGRPLRRLRRRHQGPHGRRRRRLPRDPPLALDLHRHPRLGHRLLRLGPRPPGRRGRPGHRRDLDRRQRLLHRRRHPRLRRPDPRRRARHPRPDPRLHDGRSPPRSSRRRRFAPPRRTPSRSSTVAGTPHRPELRSVGEHDRSRSTPSAPAEQVRTRAGPALVERLFAPVDIASLVAFRIAFGALMAVEAYRYLTSGWIRAVLDRPGLLLHVPGLRLGQAMGGRRHVPALRRARARSPSA